MRAIRWKMFKLISRFGWWVCPEPHRQHLQSVSITWKQYEGAGRTALRERVKK